MISFSMAGETPDRTLSIFYSDSSNTSIPEDHPKFQQILDTIIAGGTEESVRFLADLMSTVGQQLQLISERVTYHGRKVFFDGDPIHGELVDVIRDLIELGDPEELRPLVNFLEKTKTNPSKQSVDDLYNWVKNGDLVIHEDGDFLAYKGVGYGNGDAEEGLFFSKNQGEAFVDGHYHNGYIPQRVGSVVTMPRSEVDDNSAEGCSTGLHAGTHGYANGYADKALLLVKINPRDVVSVPTDSSFQKLRVCRYEVLEVIEKRLETHYYQPAWDEDEEDLDWDEDEEDLEAYWDEEEDLEDEDDDAGYDDEEDEAEASEESDDDDEDSAALSAENEYVPFARFTPEQALNFVDNLQAKFDADDAEENAQAEAEEPKPIRNERGQFTKESVQNAVRDQLGRFMGLRKQQ
jgi:hypothetical protein